MVTKSVLIILKINSKLGTPTTFRDPMLRVEIHFVVVPVRGLLWTPQMPPDTGEIIEIATCRGTRLKIQFFKWQQNTQYIYTELWCNTYMLIDSPWHYQDVGYIIWTGDLVPHAGWDTARDKNILIIDRLMALMEKYFPGVPVYPTLGNHESHPANTYQ